MTRSRVTDRATGQSLPVVRSGAEPSGPPPPGERPIVLPAATPSATRGRTAVEVVIAGWRFELEVEDAHLAELRERAMDGRPSSLQHGPTEVRAIIPGRVVAVDVVAGDVIVADQRLVAVEAMKMENELRAPRAGTVERVAVAVGQTVELGDLLVVLR